MALSLHIAVRNLRARAESHPQDLTDLYKALQSTPGAGKALSLFCRGDDVYILLLALLNLDGSDISQERAASANQAVFMGQAASPWEHRLRALKAFTQPEKVQDMEKCALLLGMVDAFVCRLYTEVVPPELVLLALITRLEVESYYCLWRFEEAEAATVVQELEWLGVGASMDAFEFIRDVGMVGMKDYYID